MIGHLSQVHDKHRKSYERYVIEGSCTRLLQKDIDKDDKVHRPVAPEGESLEEDLARVCDVFLQIYLELNTPLEQGPPVGEFNTHQDGKESQHY